jgi:hypothetical protein
MRSKRTVTPDVVPELTPEVTPEPTTAPPELTEAQIREGFTGKPGPFGTSDPQRAALLNDAIARIEADHAARAILAVRKRDAVHR